MPKTFLLLFICNSIISSISFKIIYRYICLSPFFSSPKVLKLPPFGNPGLDVFNSRILATLLSAEYQAMKVSILCTYLNKLVSLQGKKILRKITAEKYDQNLFHSMKVC